MEQYKPQYLGKIMPDEPPKLMNFMQEDFEKFSKVYDVCKGNSDSINDVKNVSTGDDLVVKVITDNDTIGTITETIDNDGTEGLSIEGDKITVTAKTST